MKNKYFNRSRLSEAKLREIIKHFALGTNASKTAIFTRINRNTINSIFQKIRLRILELSCQDSLEYGNFEVDESYFGARRVRAW